jgi:hypothetical protein
MLALPLCSVAPAPEDRAPDRDGPIRGWRASAEVAGAEREAEVAKVEQLVEELLELAAAFDEGSPFACELTETSTACSSCPHSS